MATCIILQNSAYSSTSSVLVEGARAAQGVLCGWSGPLGDDVMMVISPDACPDGSIYSDWLAQFLSTWSVVFPPQRTEFAPESVQLTNPLA